MKAISLALLCCIFATFAGTSSAQHAGHKMPPKAMAPKAMPQHFVVTVNNMRYSPSIINVKAGRPVHLVFNLGPKAGCGDTLVIPKYRIKKKLVRGKQNVVMFTPKRGRIPFTCGMNMYKGAIIAK